MTTLPTMLEQALTVAADLERDDGAACGRAWVVGGAVRDCLSGRGLDDLDVAAEHADAWAGAVAARLGSRVIALGRDQVLRRIPVADSQIDVVQVCGGIEDDLRRRDFTVDAMAAPLPAFAEGRVEQALIDPCGGRADLRAGVLRAVSDGSLTADPLRVLRGARLEQELRLSPTASTLSAMRAAAPALSEVSGERIAAELTAAASLPVGDGSHGWAAALGRLENVGALSMLMPELDDCRGVEQIPAHRRDVFGHQLDAAVWLDVLLADRRPTEPAARALWNELWRGEGLGAVDRAALRGRLDDWRAPLRIAILLHDIGKPSTRTVALSAGGGERTRFFGHAEVGAELASVRLRSLRFPSRLIARVTLLIEQHLRPGQVAAAGQAPTGRALRRFHAALGDGVAPLCWLFLADSLATVGAQALMPRWPAYTEHVGRIIGWQPRRPAQAPRLLDGDGVMAATGLGPGPLVGRIRDQIDEAAAIGAIASVKEAETLARRLSERAVESGAHGNWEGGGCA